MDVTKIVYLGDESQGLLIEIMHLVIVFGWIVVVVRVD